MYKRPPKHIQRTRLVVLYSIMTLAVISIVTLLVMMVANYRYDRTTGTFEQRSLVQFVSTPSAATVEVDAATLNSTTSTKSSVEPGDRRFAVWREGYETWILNTTIPAGSLVWLDYIRLVPKERPIEVVRRYDAVEAAVASPNNRAIISQLDAATPSFRYVDIAHDAPQGKTLQLPQSTYNLTSAETRADKKATPRFSLGTWNESSRYVLVWRTIGKEKQLIILDTEDPSKSVNVSRQFSLPIESAAFAGRSGNALYITSGGAVRKLDISGGTITRSLVSNVASFTVNDATISYVSQPDSETGARTIGVYRDGDDEPVTLRTILDEKTPVSIATRAYYGSTYTVLSEGKRVDIYQGHHDRGIDGMQLIASRTLDESIESVEFNRTGSYILLRAEQSFTSYGIDRKLFHSNKLEQGQSGNLFWIDAMHLGLVSDGVLTMRDIDGTNVFELNAATSGVQSATLSRNGTYLYSYGDARDNGVALQRIRMILR